MVDWLEKDVGPRLRRSVMDAIASDRMMIVVKAVAECDPIYDCVYCIFCLVKQWDEPQHEDDCPYILARKITEDE